MLSQRQVYLYRVDTEGIITCFYSSYYSLVYTHTHTRPHQYYVSSRRYHAYRRIRHTSTTRPPPAPVKVQCKLFSFFLCCVFVSLPLYQRGLGQSSRKCCLRNKYRGEILHFYISTRRFSSLYPSIRRMYTALYPVKNITNTFAACCTTGGSLKTVKGIKKSLFFR